MSTRENIRLIARTPFGREYQFVIEFARLANFYLPKEAFK